MKYLLLFLNKKLIISLLFLLLSIVLISFLELVGIGILVGFVALLTDPNKYIMKIPVSEIQIYLKSLSIETLSLTLIVFLIVFFIFKNLIYLLVKYLVIL